MILLTVLICLAYTFLIINLMKHWEEIPAVNIPEEYQAKIKLSVVIIARNEEGNIKKCIQSILDNDFPISSYEIIVVDDHSEDTTIQEIEGFANERIRVLHLGNFLKDGKTNAFKKAGIQYALQNAKYNHIIHTDADCVVPTNWLRITAWNFKKGTKLQAGPVGFSPVHSFLSWFQQLDMYTLMASTNAGIRSQNWYLANGANLAYAKSSLPQDIYKESNRYASGDDVYLINRFAENHGDEIVFESLIPIRTTPIENWKSFINQRKRWAGKNRQLAKGKMKNILIIPVIANLWVFILLLCIPIIPSITLGLFAFYLLTKLMVDYVLLEYMQRKTRPKEKNKHFLLAFLMYPFYFLLVGFLSLVSPSYQWKARKVQ